MPPSAPTEVRVKREKNPIAEMHMWQDRVEKEASVAAEWEVNWGFLKAPKKELKEAEPASGLCVSQKEAELYDEVEMTGRLRTEINKDKLPQQKQKRPQTTSQDIGWGQNLELFGVSKHGIKRDKGIWPQ